MRAQMQTGAETDVDVAIVGLGPVGVTLAGLLAQQGIRVLAADAAPDVYNLPRALGMDHEVMRVFQQLGAAGELGPIIGPYRPSEYRTADGDVIRRFDSQPPPYPLGWPPYMTFVQPRLEAVLRARVAARACADIRVSTEVIALADIDAAPTLTLRSRATQDTATISARYVIGCDGGQSFVRRELGIGFEDLLFDEPWIVVDMLVEPGVELPEVNIQFCDPARPHTFVVCPQNLRRWEFMLLPGENPADMAREEQVWRLLSPWLRPGQATLWRAATYRFHALVAERWRRGNVFLAGDACHMTPPFLAQGMVQGIKDAANLAWKIGAVLGGAPDALLDTYEAERRPVVKEVISIAKDLGRIICECDPALAEERNRRMRAEMAAGTGTAVRQDLFPPIAAGPLCRPSPEAAGPAGRPAPQPSVRTEDGRTALLDDVTGTGFRLLARPGFRLGPDAARTALALGIGLHTIAADRLEAGDGHLVEEDGVFRDWMAKHGHAAILVRPDHMIYAAFREPEEVPAALAAIAPWISAP